MMVEHTCDRRFGDLMEPQGGCPACDALRDKDKAVSDLPLPNRVMIGQNLLAAANHELAAAIFSLRPVAIEQARAVVIERNTVIVDLRIEELRDQIGQFKA